MPSPTPIIHFPVWVLDIPEQQSISIFDFIKLDFILIHCGGPKM